MRSINRTFPLPFIVRGDAYPVAGGNWTQLTISLANFERLARSPAGLWVLSMANCDDTTHWLGAVGSGTAAIHCLTAWGR